MYLKNPLEKVFLIDGQLCTFSGKFIFSINQYNIVILSNSDIFYNKHGGFMNK